MNFHSKGKRSGQLPCLVLRRRGSESRPVREVVWQTAGPDPALNFVSPTVRSRSLNHNRSELAVK